MKIITYLFTILNLLNASFIFAQDLKIDSDGNYVSSDKLSLDASNAIYEVSGKILLENFQKDQESYIQIGLAPFGKDGEKLNKINDFASPFDDSTNGYILLDTITLEKDGTFDFSKKIKLSGDDLKEVSFVVGASLAKGATLTISDLKLIPQKTAQAENTTENAGIGTSSNQSSTYKNQLNENSTSTSGDKTFEKKQEDVTPEKQSNSVLDSRRTIFVNSEIGSDKFQGLRRTRGQVDGPKKTIKSALDRVSDGDIIVLQQTKNPYIVSTLKTKSGGNLIIRAEGTVVIRAK